MNLLFVCSKNQWRSPTAERIFRDSHGHSTRSRGTSRSAKRKLTQNDLNWADLLFVMEDHHLDRIQQEFSINLSNERIYVLEIPDQYRFMDPELIEELKGIVLPILLELAP